MEPDRKLPKRIVVPPVSDVADARALAAAKIWDRGFGAIESWSLAQRYDILRKRGAVYAVGDPAAARMKVAESLATDGLEVAAAAAAASIAEITLLEDDKLYILEGEYADGPGNDGSFFMAGGQASFRLWLGSPLVLPGTVGRDILWVGNTAILTCRAGKLKRSVVERDLMPAVDPPEPSVLQSVLMADLRVLCDLRRAAKRPDPRWRAGWWWPPLASVIEWRHAVMAQKMMEGRRSVFAGRAPAFSDASRCPWTRRRLTARDRRFVRAAATLASRNALGGSYVTALVEEDLDGGGPDAAACSILLSPEPSPFAAHGSEALVCFMPGDETILCGVLGIRDDGPEEDREERERAVEGTLRERGALAIEFYTLNGKRLLDVICDEVIDEAQFRARGRWAAPLASCMVHLRACLEEAGYEPAPTAV